MSTTTPDAPRAIWRPRVAKHEPRLTDGEVHPVTTRALVWAEVRLSDCAYGCKVYEAENGRREVQHNANYNCPRAGERERVTA